jgi:hypothetical protein
MGGAEAEMFASSLEIQRLQSTRLCGGVEFVDVGRLGYRDAEPVTLDRDLAAGDGVAGGQNPKFVSFLGVERDNSAPTHAQKLLHRHRAAAEDDGQLDIDVMDLAFTGHATTPFDSALVEPERVAGA